MTKAALYHEFRERFPGWWCYQFQFVSGGLCITFMDHRNISTGEQMSGLHVEINDRRRDVDLTDINPVMVGLE